MGAGHARRVVAGVRGQRRGERRVVRRAPGPDGGQDRGEPGPEVGVAHARGGVVDGRVDPGVAVAVPAEQRLQGRRADGGVPRQPAGQPHRGVEGRGPLVGVREPVGGHPGPGPLDVRQRGTGKPRQVRIGRGRARQDGPQRARQRREPAGQPGREQVRAVGQGVGADGGEQFVGAGEQRLAVAPAGRILEHPGQDRRRLPGPGPQHRAGRRGTAEPGFEPDQGLAGQLRRLRRPVHRCGDQPGDQPERYGVAGLAGPQQVPQRRPGRPGPFGRPVQDGAGQGVSGQRPQVRDPGDNLRVRRPGQHAGGVDDRIGQAEMRGGHGAERMVAGQHPARGRRPASGRGGRQQADRDIPVPGRGGQGGLDPGGGEAEPDRVPGIGGAQPVPHEMAEHARAEIVVRAVGQHDQPLATGPPEQRLADGQRRHARHDPHRHVGVGELLRPRPLVGTRPHPEHTRQVILAARLVQQRPQDGKRGPGRRHRHSCTRHSTTTCSSRCASRNACSGPSTSLAGAPLARVVRPARPEAAATAARRWARHRAVTGGGGTGSRAGRGKPLEDGVVGLRQSRAEPGRELVGRESLPQRRQHPRGGAAAIVILVLGGAQRGEPVPSERVHRRGDGRRLAQ